MRNYLKLQCVRIYIWTPPDPLDPLFFYVTFYETEEEMLKYVNRVITQVLDPGQNYLVGDPTTIWFELNSANFVKLINEAAGQFWTVTHLNNVFVIDPTDPYNEVLYDQTSVEPEPSPRKTWSHGK